MSDRITQIESRHLTVPLPEPLRLGGYEISARDYVLVRVRDSDGCSGSCVGLSRGAPVGMTIQRTITSRIVGTDLSTWSETYRRVVTANTTLGTNGIFWRALSLVDCAVYDLMAHRRGVPLYTHLGGMPRDVPRGFVGGYPVPGETDDSLGDQARRAAGLGAAFFKIGSSGDFERDNHRLRAVRNAIPRGPDLVIDLYWQCESAERLLPWARKWVEYRMAWVEDPFAFDDIDSARELSAAVGVAIGDEQSGVRHMCRLMDEGRVRVLRLDATVCGGVTAFLQIAREAGRRGVPVSCHVFHPLHEHLARAVGPVVGWTEQFLPGSPLDALEGLWREESDTALEQPGVGWGWNETLIDRNTTEVLS